MSRRERERSRTNDPAGVRRRVLDVAAGSFQQHGYGRTSMSDLVQAAQVSGGALYHHFPSKRDLALAVVKERVSAELAETWIAAVENAGSAAEGIVGVFEEVAEALERRGAVSGCPLGNLALELSLSDDGLRGAIDQEYQTWRLALRNRLARDISEGKAGYAGGDPEGFADMVVAMFTGAMSIAKAEQAPTALRGCARQLRRLTRPQAGD